MRRFALPFLLLALPVTALAPQNPTGLAKPGTATIKDRFEPLPTPEVTITA